MDFRCTYYEGCVLCFPDSSRLQPDGYKRKLLLSSHPTSTRQNGSDEASSPDGAVSVNTAENGSHSTSLDATTSAESTTPASSITQTAAAATTGVVVGEGGDPPAADGLTDEERRMVGKE